MISSMQRVQFWNHLLEVAERIEGHEGEDARKLVLEQLETLSEAFGDNADPVENFEEFVVIRLSQAIHSALTRQPH